MVARMDPEDNREIVEATVGQLVGHDPQHYGGDDGQDSWPDYPDRADHPDRIGSGWSEWAQVHQ